MNEQNKQDVIDLNKIFSKIWSRRKVYYCIIPIVFALSCLWVLPQPRYYQCSVELAPEAAAGGMDGIAGLASSFGFNIGGTESTDAIYPMLYPSLFESTEFIVGLFDIQIETDETGLQTDYYDYLCNHQKKNWLTAPFKKWKNQLIRLIAPEPAEKPKATDGKVNPFRLTKKEDNTVKKIAEKINCKVDKKTDVISITVQDQDRLVCALLADSLKMRLQDFIIDYRTKKSRQDVDYYQNLTDSTRLLYEESAAKMAAYNDAHRGVVLQSYVEQGERLRNDMNLKLQTYNTFAAQLAAAKAKVQERTPSFTTLKSATVPQKPAGPKRMTFIIIMEFLACAIASVVIARKEIF